ncbi:MAG: hypothetical protein Q9187_002152, partial [Circinaria calcarea]
MKVIFSVEGPNLRWLRRQQRFFSTDRTFVEASLKSTRDDGPTEDTTKWRYAIYATPLVRKSFTSKPRRQRIGKIRNESLEALKENTLDGHGNGSEARGKTLAEALSSHLNGVKPFPRRSPNPMLESVQRSLVDATLDNALDIASHQNKEHEQPASLDGLKTPLAMSRQGNYRSKTPASRASPLAKPGGVHLPDIVGKRMYTTSATRFAIPGTQASFDTNQILDLLQSKSKPLGIRDRLRAWQEDHELSGEQAVDQYDLEDIAEPGALQNFITRRGPINQIADDSILEDQDNGRAVAFGTDDDRVPDIVDSRVFLQQGDLVELLTGGSSMLAVFIQNIGNQLQFYTIKGKWIHRLPRRILFSVPRFINKPSVVTLLPYLPTTLVPDSELDKLQSTGVAVPREAGAPLINAMLKFERAADKVYREHADKLDSAYTVMAHEKHFRYATTTEIAMKVLAIRNPEKISIPIMFAVHRVLVHDDLGFRVDYRHHRTTSMFEIQPRREVALVKQVRHWLRQYQENAVTLASGDPISHKASLVDNPIPGFVKKARRLIMESRKTRAVTQSGGIGPSSIKVTPVKPYMSFIEHVSLETFTEKESVIIRFLEFWSSRRSMKQYSPLNSLGPMILRATGMYEGFDLAEGTGLTLLQELGVLMPWENPVAFDTRLALPGHNYDLKTDSLQADAFRSFLGSELEDSMADLRKDWGELEVYCVDSADAKEIDDGFSLERIDEDPSQFWIHVHVANPTAFIPPDHPVAQYAARLTETLYFPETVYYMLSPRLTQARFSLRKNRPSLTFSVKMNLNGEILETKITPSTIRNVHFFTPKDICDALAVQGSESRLTSSFSVGGTVPNFTREDLGKGLTQEQTTTLQMLQRLGVARRRVRESRGFLNVRMNQTKVAVYFTASGPSPLLLPWRSKARRLEGDPVISMEVKMFDPTVHAQPGSADEAEMLVPELMILAGEVAAMWCSERNIPVLYRGTQSNPERQNPVEFKEQILAPAIAKGGCYPFLLLGQYIVSIGKGVSLSTPQKHITIGTDAYTKVTSPLRRYGDMLAHWQIEAAIRQEASTGTSLVGSM